MPVVKVNEDRCKGCGLCIHFCPGGVLELSREINREGYYPVVFARPEDCTGCTFCALMCPDCALGVFREVKAR
jgi:2-oxoglutarate ferredoxin oxidoreductase subunit delta